MSLARILAVACGMSVIGLIGCATLPEPCPIIQLNDAQRSTYMSDVLSEDSSAAIPYEARTIENVDVWYNLQYERDPHCPGYRLTVVFTNRTSSDLAFSPQVVLSDSSGMLMPAIDQEGYLRLAAQLQETEFKSTSPVSSAGGETHGPMGAFLEGARLAEADNAVRGTSAANERGRKMTYWGSTYWLKDEIHIPSESSLLGVRWFPATRLARLPMRIRISVVNRVFEFVAPGNLTP